MYLKESIERLLWKGEEVEDGGENKFLFCLF